MEKGAPAPSSSLQAALAAIPAGWMAFIVCVLLAGVTFAVFGQTMNFDFVPYDDGAYVYDNPEVVHGLSFKSIGWAFSHSDLYLWTPLSTISHMLDCQLYGLQYPGGHHLTNVALHIAAVIALFLVLWRATGQLWPCAFVAAVFAIHPLRAESVAWIAERKDVLCGVFFMLALGAHVFYTRKRTVARYALIAVAMALGLMSKQMIVTLPCVLLLLDYWPLGRFAEAEKAGRGEMRVFVRLFVEKLPLFALSAASCVQSLIGRTPEAGKVATGLNQSSWLRVENALVSYIIYIGKMFYPVKLAAYYPYPASIPAWQVAGAAALLAAVSIAVFVWRKRQPALFTGWFWYLGMMVPVIGFVPLGKEGHADRYTYLPEIGLVIMATWGVASLAAAIPFRREILSIAAALVIAVLMRLAVEQTKTWQDGVALWENALACTPDNGITRNFLGFAYERAGRMDDAMAEYKKSIALMPSYAEPENNLGVILLDNNDVEGAIKHFERALQIDEGHVEARDNLAAAYIQEHRLDDAEKQLRMVIKFRPKLPEAYNLLGGVLVEKGGDMKEAIDLLQKALEINPDFAGAHVNLGNALLEDGQARGALYQYQKALKLTPDDVVVQLKLAKLLATCPDDKVRNGNAAVELASRTNELSGGHIPEVLDVLAAAYAEAHRFDEAIETARRAAEIATADGKTELAAEIQAHLELYRASTPLRVPLKGAPGS
ncbi:MAG TPA: tetratricopeptide repeat protein [Chthoniobacteraceae bacterium]|nr:tetratricopeptide repeat protein [Chthoniobacteraceae bacterium]